MDSKNQLVNGLPLPTLLAERIYDGRWRHPGDAQLLRLMPYLQDPVDFLSIESMRRESSGKLADHPDSSKMYRLARGSGRAEGIQLPWLDVDLAYFIAVNRTAGDDIAIALDFRTSTSDPRVVASDWTSEKHRCVWRVVTESFSDFANLISTQ